MRIYTALLHGIFFLSGACALAYQLAWIRLFSLEFGSTTLAVATVVSMFLGGLAIGAVWGGQIGANKRKALRTYGLLELGISGYALSSPLFFSTLLTSLGLVATSIYDDTLAVTALRTLVAALLILPPTFLMGATLPVLSAWLHQHSGGGTFRATTLYSWNTFGATAGTLTAGFVLLPHYGTQTTVALSGIVNLALAGLALVLSVPYSGRRARIFSNSHNSIAPSGFNSNGKSTGTMPLLVGAAVAAAAAGTMASQVIWTRVATLVLGASVYAFTLVLATFLAGLGLGALITSWFLRGRPDSAQRVFIFLALGSATTLVAMGYVFPYLPVISASIQHSFDLNESHRALLFVQLFLAACLILPATLLFGGLLPAALRAFGTTDRRLSKDIGAIYAWDVLGSIAGVLIAGFFLLPLLGVVPALTIAASALLAAAILVEVRKGIRGGLKGVTLASALGVFFWVGAADWDQQLMTSGVHSYAEAYRNLHSPQAFSEYLGERERLLFYADGLTATVSVVHRRGSDGSSYLLVATDGKIDGSSHFDMPTQRLAAHFPILLHPDPVDIAIVGMGTGSTAGSASLHANTHVQVVEIESKMVDAARLFWPHNHSVHERDNVVITVTDGRLHLLRKRDTYDVVISVPSNPWLAGSADLFTADFFSRAATALKDGGIFAQWVQLYGMSADNFKMVLRGFLKAFPESILVTTIPETDVLLIGSREPLIFDVGKIALRMKDPQIASDLADARVGVDEIFDLFSRVRMLPEELRVLAGDGELHTDDRPLLAYRAPLDLHRATRRENENEIAALATGVAQALSFTGWPHELQSDFLAQLADAYTRFLPGGREAIRTREVILRTEATP